MPAIMNRSWTVSRLLRRGWPFLLIPPLGLVAVSWWLTEPLEDTPAPISPAPPKVAAATTPSVTELPPWPTKKLEGEPAKKLLLQTLAVVAARLEEVPSYSATMRKQERLKGKLGPEQTLAIKIRNRPFAFYAKFLAPKAGKEVVYAEGHHNNHVIAHNGDLTRLLVPRLAVPPTSPVALADSRHPVTEAGLVYLTNKLLNFRKMDLGDPEAVTELDWAPGLDGRLWPRSVHRHPHPSPDRPFALIEILYDPETRLPRHLSNYDWPKADESAEPQLAERYIYLDLDLKATFTDRDFDPANPDYGFHRF